MEERKLYSELPNVESLQCLLGLNFPESATEFQKACLTLCRLFACVRDYVLKGLDVHKQKDGIKLNTLSEIQ